MFCSLIGCIQYNKLYTLAPVLLPLQTHWQLKSGILNGPTGTETFVLVFIIELKNVLRGGINTNYIR